MRSLAFWTLWAATAPRTLGLGDGYGNGYVDGGGHGEGYVGYADGGGCGFEEEAQDNPGLEGGKHA